MPRDFLHNHRQFADLIRIVAQAQGIAPALVEKDYWIMQSLYGLQQLGLTFELKGGTSLSKAFNAIRRFSEDIDLSFDRAELGYTGERDPEKEGISRKQAARLSTTWWATSSGTSPRNFSRRFVPRSSNNSAPVFANRRQVPISRSKWPCHGRGGSVSSKSA